MDKHIFILFSYKMRISTFYRLLLLFIFAVQYINKVKPFFIYILIYQTKMRTLRLIGLAIVAIVMSVNFAACSDDDDDFNTDDLVGLWEGVTSEFEEKENGQVVDQDDAENIDDERIRFNSDGTLTSYYKGGSTWVIEDEGTWSVKDGKIYMRGDGEEVVKILELSPQKLVVEISESGVEDGISYSYYEKSTYKKITE